jgi:hypothetical protein
VFAHAQIKSKLPRDKIKIVTALKSQGWKEDAVQITTKTKTYNVIYT